MISKILEFLLASIMFIGIPVLGILFLISPFLIVKFVLKRKFNWWIIILCLTVAFGIYQAEVWAWWKFWEWGLAKIGEGFLSTF
jgi:ABC-type amino acid transport system permease subunit